MIDVGPVRARLAARGVSATMLNVGGFAVGLIALPLIAKGHSWIGLGFVVLGRLLAHLGSEDELGRALALIAFAGVPFAFALADPSRAVAASFLLFGFVALAAVRRLETVEQLAALLAIAVACLMPAWFSLIAYGLGIACFVLAGMRLARS